MIDMDVGQITAGCMTLGEMGLHVFQLYLGIASGHQQAWAEKYKLHSGLSLFNPASVT